MVICLERGANDLHMVQLMPLPPYHLNDGLNHPSRYSFLPKFLPKHIKCWITADKVTHFFTKLPHNGHQFSQD